MESTATAMQLLIIKLNRLRDSEPDKHERSSLNFAINTATELLELEKNNIIKAYDEGWQNCDDKILNTGVGYYTNNYKEQVK